MEGLTCGADNCTKYMFVGDEYNYVTTEIMKLDPVSSSCIHSDRAFINIRSTSDEHEYQLNLADSSSSTAVVTKWDLLNSIIGAVSVDKGIEAITYNSVNGYFYVGVKDTSMVHVVSLAGGANVLSSASPPPPTTLSSASSSPSVPITTTQSPSTSSSLSTGALVGIVGGVVLIGAIGAAVYIMGKRESSKVVTGITKTSV